MFGKEEAARHGLAEQEPAPRLSLPLKTDSAIKNTDITVQLLGGDLVIKYTDDTVYMTGNAVVAFDGNIII